MKFRGNCLLSPNRNVRGRGWPAGRVAAAFLMLTILSSCSRKTSVNAELSDLAKSFPSVNSTGAAPTEAVAYVNAALVALHQNDYAGGMVALQAARRMPEMTPQQLKAVQESMEAITSDLVSRAANGDADAKAALAAIERTRSQ